MISLLNTKSKFLRKNSLYINYFNLQNLSFFAIPVISEKSNVINNIRLHLRKNSYNIILLKLSYFKNIDFTNQYLLIYNVNFFSSANYLKSVFEFNNINLNSIYFFYKKHIYYHVFSFNEIIISLDNAKNLILLYDVVLKIISVISSFINLILFHLKCLLFNLNYITTKSGNI